MVGYVNFMQLNQPGSGGDTLQIQGNPVANHEVVASAGTSAAAGESAHYARVLVSVLSTVSATNLKDTPGGNTNLGNGKTVVVPANGILEIPNITRDTQITVTDV